MKIKKFKLLITSLLILVLLYRVVLLLQRLRTIPT